MAKAIKSNNIFAFTYDEKMFWQLSTILSKVEGL